MAEIPVPSGYSSGSKERPLGVTILAILMMLGGLLNLLGAGSVIYGPIYMVYSVAAGVIGLFLGYSMWTLTPWARKAAIIWYIISLISSIAMSFLLGSILDLFYPGMGTMTMLIAMIPSLVISLIIILYLNSGGVKAAFQEVGGW